MRRAYVEEVEGWSEARLAGAQFRPGTEIFPRKGAMNRTFSATLRSVSPSSGLARGWLCGAPLARRCS
jgi:hypothetical protein